MEIANPATMRAGAGASKLLEDEENGMEQEVWMNRFDKIAVSLCASSLNRLFYRLYPQSHHEFLF
ncbi:hypothetical protein [Noviherbaspirillum massiliense]|uniref:hypothetical protein n=1 Tax=Noviherbaspirillum massiliense TaxID=1465823 RepID=UPI00030D7278|nr:hypothetical protein [Noviherbaspirillum massiliense]